MTKRLEKTRQSCHAIRGARPCRPSESAGFSDVYFHVNPCVHPLVNMRQALYCRTFNDSPRASRAPNFLEPKAFELLLGRALTARLDFFGPPQSQLNNKNKPNTAPSREAQRARSTMPYYSLTSVVQTRPGTASYCPSPTNDLRPVPSVKVESLPSYRRLPQRQRVMN